MEAKMKLSVLLIVGLFLILPFTSAIRDTAEPLSIRTQSYNLDTREYTLKCIAPFAVKNNDYIWAVRADQNTVYEETLNSDTFTFTYDQDVMYHVGCFVFPEDESQDYLPQSPGLIVMYDLHIDRRIGPYTDRPNLEVHSANNLTVSATCAPHEATNYNTHWFWNYYDEHYTLSEVANQESITVDAPRYGLWELACGVWDIDREKWTQTAITIDFLPDGGQAYVPSLTACVPGDYCEDLTGSSNTTVQNATLTITKQVINDDGGTQLASDFSLFIDAQQVTSGNPVTLMPGAYTVSEGAHSGYDSSIGGDCATNGIITLNPGDEKECIITNNDIANNETNATCAESVHDVQASCSGVITQDSSSGSCRTLVCDGLQVLACNKPDAGPYEYFEMYKQSSAAGVELCLGETCIAGNGFARSENYPICTEDSEPSDPVCGNGVLESGEQCDDNNTNNDDGCSSTCQTETVGPVCGNGVVESGEQCDDNNTDNDDGCSSTCQNEDDDAEPSVCAQSIAEAPALCTHSTKNSDTLSGTCRIIECVSDSGILRVKACDKGSGPDFFEMYNQLHTDTNINFCLGDTCLNGWGYKRGEDYPICSDGTPTGPVCGNGVVESGEQCDDNNTDNDDGCSSTCQTETAGPVCGNGVVESGEQCDDNNTDNGDGCSSTCEGEEDDPSPSSAELRIADWYPQGNNYVFICDIEADSYAWIFGDGHTQVTGSDNVYHTYAPGEYEVSCSGSEQTALLHIVVG